MIDTRVYADDPSPRIASDREPAEPTAPSAPEPSVPTPSGDPGIETPNPDGGAPGGSPEPSPPPPSFPVPPVPPPPIAVNLGGTGGGGAASFARVGSEAAAPYRTPFFATNRVQGSGLGLAGAPPSRFGPGVPSLGGTVAPSFDATGGMGADTPTPNSDDDLAKIIAAVAGRRQQR
jgi:hypothetical protein